jgi:hypothetical protein
VNDFERAVRWQVITSLRDGSRSPSLAALAESLAASEDDVAHALQSLADAHVLVLRPGSTDVWMAHPFSAIETDHVVRSGERRWYANCAWDAFAVLGLLGDGHYTTACPATASPLGFEVEGGAVRGDGVIHFLVPPRSFWDDIGFT